MSQETVEIDPEKLSKDVKEDLKDELGMDDSFAEEKAKQVHLDNIDTVEADSTKPSEIINNYFNSLIGNLNKDRGKLLNKTSRTGVITDIEPKYDDMVQLSIDVGDDIVKRVISEDSKKLSHIAKYHNIEKLSNLQGKKIFYYTKHSSEIFIIPQDINTLSNFRYKFYGIQNSVKSRIDYFYHEYDDLTFNSTVGSIGFSTIIYVLNLGSVFNMLALIGLSYGLFTLILGIFAFISICLDDDIRGKNYEF